MDYTIKIRGKNSLIHAIPSVVAVLPNPEGFGAEASLESVASSFGKAIQPEKTGLPKGADLPAFKERLSRKGDNWVFVEPEPAVKEMADGSGYTKDSDAVRNVYVGKNGTLIGTARVTLQFVEDMPLEDAEKAMAADGLRMVEKLSFAENLYEAVILPGGVMLETVQKLQDMTAKYKFIEPVFIESIGERAVPDPADFVLQWHHANNGQGGGTANADIGSPAAWAVTRGSGVRVAVIDTGMHLLHPSFQGALYGGGVFISHANGQTTFSKWRPGAGDGFPISPHGTFCLGMVGARANDTGVCGSAPEAELMAVACTGQGLGTQLALAKAVAFAANPGLQPGAEAGLAGADVIVCSLGPENSQSSSWEMTSALELAISKAAAEGRKGLGVPIFWAASNGPHNIIDDEVCSHPDVLAISRSTRSDTDDGAAFGEKLEFLAPGVGVVSTDSGGGFATRTGCSYAAPLAAGVAALVISRHPEWTRDQIAERLRNTCDPAGGGHTDHSGWGRINAGRAVADGLG